MAFTYKKKRTPTNFEVLETAILMALSLAKVERNYLLAYYGIGEGEAALVSKLAIWAKELEESISKFHWEDGHDWYEEIDAYILERLKEYKTVWLLRGGKSLEYKWLGNDSIFEVMHQHAHRFDTKDSALEYTKHQKYKLIAVEAYIDRFNDTNILE